MSLTTDINKMKEDLTEEDLAKMKRDFNLHETILNTYDNNQDLIKFLLLFTVTYLNNAHIDMEDFIADLRIGDGAYKTVSKSYKKGGGH